MHYKGCIRKYPKNNAFLCYTMFFFSNYLFLAHGYKQNYKINECGEKKNI